MKLRSPEELLVKTFVQRVSAATTFAKRFKRVSALLSSSPQLSPQQWLYVWRGMYYSVWYSEMTKGCDQLIQTIGTHEDETMLLSGFTALTKDWFGIDVFRLDKYMLLVRVMINTCLKLQTKFLLDNTFTDEKTIETNDNDMNGVEEAEEDIEENDKQTNERKEKRRKRFAPKKEIVFDIEFKSKIIDEMLSTVKSSIGLSLHLSDVFIDEMVKVLTEMRDKLKVNERIEFYYHIFLPFVKLMAVSEDYRVINNVKQNVFFRFKNEILVGESVDTRNVVMKQLIDAMMTIGGVEDIARKNRDSIYDLVSHLKKKVNQLSETDVDKKSVKRKKILMGRGRHKRVKYEITSSSPFVRSIVPIAVL